MLPIEEASESTIFASASKCSYSLYTGYEARLDELDLTPRSYMNRDIVTFYAPDAKVLLLFDYEPRTVCG
ncbi:hypothetical protein CCR75_009797 [Bremia lactucae]|uniref:Uncharacterized protein n=1 Tax=Bremia lactucae TaxID=4779 RepID=A0A976IC88_BRELC|nr:hypothetical protein CCR75_009797 [Bremia lactucae]